MLTYHILPSGRIRGHANFLIFMSKVYRPDMDCQVPVCIITGFSFIKLWGYKFFFGSSLQSKMIVLHDCLIFGFKDG